MKRIKIHGHLAYLTALHLMLNAHANMIGVYYQPYSYLSCDLFLEMSEVKCIMEKLIKDGFCEYDQDKEYIWVCDLAEMRVGESLKVNDNQVKGVRVLIEELPELTFMNKFIDRYAKAFHLSRYKNGPLDDPCKPLRRGLQGP
jgi:hypothetical protein